MSLLDIGPEDARAVRFQFKETAIFGSGC